MQELREKMSSHANKLSVKLKSAFKTAAVLTMGAMIFASGTGHAAAVEKTKLTTVFHVYADDEFIGIVADQEEVEALLHEKKTGMEEKYNGVSLELDKKISFVPEQVFRSITKEASQSVIENLVSAVMVKAKAYALEIGGQTVVNVKSQEEAQEVIEKLKLSYINEEELAAAEKLKQSAQAPLPALKENETRILDVSLSENVAISETKINPEEFMTVEDAVTLFKKGTLEEKTYKVKDGDVLGTIASAHGLKLEQLLSLNNGMTEDTVLKPDQELKVTAYEPFADVLVTKETYKVEKIPFEKEIVEDPNMFKGDTKVKQEGKEGRKGVTYKISQKNGTTLKNEAVNTTVIEEPVKEIIVKGTKVIPSRGEGKFQWPANGGYISSHLGYRWGKMHKGIDIARPSDYTIKASDNGVVVSAGYDGGYGNKVVIDHQNGYRTVYAHLASISVSPGQTVPRGTKIGVMGRTGDSTGIHLHFEVYKNGALIDPMNVLNR